MNKKRSPNFSAKEEKLLLVFVNKYAHVMECKKNDSVSNRAKKDHWIKIAELHNEAMGIHGRRDWKVLRKKYENMKKTMKTGQIQDKDPLEYSQLSEFEIKYDVTDSPLQNNDTPQQPSSICSTNSENENQAGTNEITALRIRHMIEEHTRKMQYMQEKHKQDIRHQQELHDLKLKYMTEEHELKILDL